MKIKTTKKMRLDELIKYVWEKEAFGSERNHQYESERGKVVSIDGGTIGFDEHNHRIVLRGDLFPVEVEEELTEETEFDELWEVYYNKGRDDVDAYTDGKVNGVTSTSISQILEENSIDYENVTLAIFRKDTLIWSKDTGIPAEGVIEV